MKSAQLGSHDVVGGLTKGPGCRNAAKGHALERGEDPNPRLARGRDRDGRVERPTRLVGAVEADRDALEARGTPLAIAAGREGDGAGRSGQKPFADASDQQAPDGPTARGAHHDQPCSRLLGDLLEFACRGAAGDYPHLGATEAPRGPELSKCGAGFVKESRQL